MIYYGYKRGDNDKVVDWSSVSGELTENLRNIEQEREKERNRIEGEIAEASNSINDVPMGNYESMNSFILGASNQAAEQLRIQSRLLRNGQLKPSEFARFRQNLLDGMSGYKKVADSYNTKMDEFVTRQQDMTAGQLEAYSAKMLQNTANLQNMVSFVDPVTGVVMNAPKDKDGKPIMDQAMSPRDMLNLAAQKYDRFDMNAQLDPIVEKYGKEIRVLKSGGVLTRSDILQRRFGASKKTMDEVIDDTMKQYTPEQLSSVLLDHDGGYKVTNDPKQRDANPDEYILVGRDGSLANRLSPNLTPEQTDKARQLIKEQLLAKLDLIETPYTPPTSGGETDAQRKAGEAREKAKGYVTALQDLFTADDPKKRTAAMANLAGAIGQDRFISMEMNDAGDAIIFTGIDKDDNVRKTQQIPLEGTFEDFVKNYGKILTGTDDVWTYYDEVIDSPDVSSLTPSVGAGGKYEIGFEEDLSQKLTDLASIGNVLDIQPLATENYYLESSKIRDSKKYVQKFIEASQIKGLSYNVDDTKKMTISHPELGTLPPIRLNRDEDIIVSDLKEALYKMYEAATTGKPLEGTTGDNEEEIDASKY